MPDHPHRHPRDAEVTFALYHEGGGVHALYLSGIPSRRVARALFPAARDGQLVVLSPLPAPAGCTPLPAGGWMGPGERILGIREPVEILLLDAPVPPAVIDARLPSTLLARPDLAVPADLGARFAVVLEPPRHAVLLARDPALHAALLEEALAVAVYRELGRDAPRVTRGQASDLLQPVEQGAWRRVRVRSGAGFHALQVETLDSEAHGASLDRLIWIARRGARLWNHGSPAGTSPSPRRGR